MNTCTCFDNVQTVGDRDAFCGWCDTGHIPAVIRLARQAAARRTLRQASAPLSLAPALAGAIQASQRNAIAAANADRLAHQDRLARRRA